MLLLSGRVGKIVQHIAVKFGRYRGFRVKLVDMVLKLFGGGVFELLDNLLYQRIVVAQLEEIAPVVIAIGVARGRNLYPVSTFVVIVLTYPKLNGFSYVAEIIKFAVQKILI